MKLEDSFVKEIKKVNGDGGREAYFAFYNKARDAAKALSTPQVLYTFSDIIGQYGRAAVGICVAATIVARAKRLDYRSAQWANEVLALWYNRPSDLGSVLIDDGLHPTRIEVYARVLMEATRCDDD